MYRCPPKPSSRRARDSQPCGARSFCDGVRHPFDDAVALFADSAGVQPSVAHAEVVKCSMFPGTPVMYWLGTQGILDLREQLRVREGASFSLKRFHDELLGYGSISVPLIARMMTQAGSA